ncbi:MAG TPA: SDR family oxidoreductase [Candidatus Binatia bacterium]|jgi:NAD(P)-dependent dehydrogenase (short-subunit alcohol dehydrogenase family)|nr:SDR family oxidoreductase [Candidatus Binatia bacterium]
MGTHATIVTGGGRGIGRAVALRMAAEGPVVIVGRTAADLASAAEAIAAAGGDVAVVQGDVRDPGTAAAAVEAARSRGWTVRALVCNAGIGRSGPTATFPMDLWREIFAVNVEGAMQFVQACLPSMVEQGGGTIVLMASIAGLNGYAYTAAYAASKHALVGLARSLAQEYGKAGIVAVPVCPGFVESEMTERTVRGVMERRGVTEAEARERVARANPQRRILPPEEVAEAVAFVCSGKAPSLGGNPLVLSGGE